MILPYHDVNEVSVFENPVVGQHLQLPRVQLLGLLEAEGATVDHAALEVKLEGDRVLFVGSHDTVLHNDYVYRPQTLHADLVDTNDLCKHGLAVELGMLYQV